MTRPQRQASSGVLNKERPFSPLLLPVRIWKSEAEQCLERVDTHPPHRWQSARETGSAHPPQAADSIEPPPHLQGYGYFTCLKRW